MKQVLIILFLFTETAVRNLDNTTELRYWFMIRKA